MKNKNVLITGGMGFIGNHLAYTLLQMGAKVTILDKSIYKPMYHDISNATIVEGDVLSQGLLVELLAQTDVCFHLAAISSVVACDRDWIYSHENNVLAFNGLLESIYKTPHPVKLIYASSAAVYGNHQQLPLCESHHLTPISAYGADKLSNELYAEVMHYAHDVHSIGLRFFNVYGPGQLSGNPYSGVISKFRDQIQNEKPIIINGDGEQKRDFIFIKDVIRALLLSAETPGDTHGVWNVCTGKAISINELAQIMVEHAAVDIPIHHGEPRAGDLRYSYGSPENARNDLSFVASVSIEAGLRQYFLALNRS